MIEQIKDQRIDNLSGGELQRVALAMCLGKPADVYLIDEPSAYLDSEQLSNNFYIFYPSKEIFNFHRFLNTWKIFILLAERRKIP